MKSPNQKETTFSLESTQKGTKDWWWRSAAMTLNVSTDPKYTFGFTGFSGITVEEPEEPDEFEVFVREERKKAGITDPEPERKRQILTNSQYAPGGQILYSGTIKVPSPRYTRQVYGIIPAGSDKPSDE